MSKSPISEEEYARMETYLDGSMPETDRPAYEALLAADERLRTAYVDYAAVVKALADEPAMEMMRKKVTAWAMEAPAPTPTRVPAPPARRWMGWSVAAGIGLLCLLGGWWLTRPTFGQRLCTRYFSPDPRAIYELGPAKGNSPGRESSSQAMQAYQSADYPGAIAQFQAALTVDPTNDTLRYFQANALLAAGDAAAAKVAFEELVQAASEAFSPMSRWYAALASLHLGDFKQARQAIGAIALDPSHPMQATAAELLNELPE